MTQSLLTTSIGSLTSQVAYRPTFSPVPLSRSRAFDEGPTNSRWKPDDGTSVSGSLNNLSSSYPFVQGVEITKQSQYTKGVFKIWSGDSQHELRPAVFGQERMFTGDTGFVESDRFSAEALVRNAARSFTSDDDGPIESYSANGIIEPLTIRRAVKLSTVPNDEPHSVKAAFMAGTVDVHGSSVAILSIDISAIPEEVSGFVDGTLADVGAFGSRVVLAPFSDTRLVRSVPVVDSEPVDMVAALSEMTGSSTDDHVRHNQRSAPCGWYYDNTRAGTDSLAFGGMTY
jgi:hypothetical protein